MIDNPRWQLVSDCFEPGKIKPWKIARDCFEAHKASLNLINTDIKN